MPSVTFQWMFLSSSRWFTWGFTGMYAISLSALVVSTEMGKAVPLYLQFPIGIFQISVWLRRILTRFPFEEWLQGRWIINFRLEYHLIRIFPLGCLAISCTKWVSSSNSALMTGADKLKLSFSFSSLPPTEIFEA